MSTPTVSVIIPTYNRADLLPRAIESVAAQTFNDWEIVLVDDGSTDNTAELAIGYAARFHYRFVYIRQKNQGSSAARNTGIDAGSGHFVTFLDSDDEFLPTKLERQLALFEHRPELGFVYSDYAFVDLEGVRHESAFTAKWPGARAVPHQSVAPGLYVCKAELFDFLLRGYFIATIVGMVRRDVLGGAIRFSPHIAYAEEWLFYLQVARACRAGFVDEPLCVHHYTAGSLARTDRSRNIHGHCEVLRAVSRLFDDLTPVQRPMVRRNLARACRQLGYDAYRGRQYQDACRNFWESFRAEPCMGVLAEVVQSAARSIITGRKPEWDKSCPSQELSEVTP